MMYHVITCYIMIHQNKTKNKIKKKPIPSEIGFFHDRLIAQTPFNPVLGVFDIKTERGEFVAGSGQTLPNPSEPSHSFLSP